MSNISLGVLIALAAGLVNGSFAAPTKYTTRWKWENIWAVWAVVALFITPWLLAFLTIPDLLGFYQDTSVGFILLLVAFGFGVGLSQVFFGLALAAVGLSIGFAVTIGLSTALGSLVPLVLLHPGEVLTPRGTAVIAGVALILVGTGCCGLASGKKNRDAGLRAAAAGDRLRQRFSAGLLLCILAGVLSPLVNLALAFGSPMMGRAAQLGVGPAHQANVIWPPLLTSTMVPYLAYCSYLWHKNRSFRLFVLPATGLYWLFGTVMGLLWTGSLALYGAASTRMAGMGPILGWPLFMSVIIISSNVWGFATGEWRGARTKTITLMLVGIGFLIMGFVTVALAARLS
ncbi:MAG TPA: L-rhamnose/proton symporter RhaT [Terriglobia bacterium]|nr:L-rhamnose/proton symporter RhaT [Terriglobia bacterium]